MNLKQKIYILQLMDRMYASWCGYVSAPLSDYSQYGRDEAAALRMADVCVKDECNMARLDGACTALGLNVEFDSKKKEIRILKNNKVKFYINQNDCNYDFDDLTMQMIEKGLVDYE